jgi:hypothetical protein
MNTTQKLKVGLVAFLVLSWMGTPQVWAADPERPWKTLTLKGGYFFSNSNTELRFDGPGSIGNAINLEKVLGLDENVDTYDVGVEWRFFDRHRFNVNYFDLSRTGSKHVTGTIDLPDGTENFDIALNTEFDWKVFSATYTWSFLQTNTYEVGFTIGANITKLTLGIETFQGKVEAAENATLPLPVLGLSAAYAFTPKLILRGDGGWFGIKIGDVDGSQWVGSIDLEYNMWKYVGFGLGYRYYRIDVGVTDEDWRGDIQYDYNGFQAFLKFYL